MRTLWCQHLQAGSPWTSCQFIAVLTYRENHFVKKWLSHYYFWKATIHWSLIINMIDDTLLRSVKISSIIPQQISVLYSNTSIVTFTQIIHTVIPDCSFYKFFSSYSISNYKELWINDMRSLIYQQHVESQFRKSDFVAVFSLIFRQHSNGQH